MFNKFFLKLKRLPVGLISGYLFVALAVLIIWLSRYGLTNWHLYTLTSGSMRPNLPMTSLIFVQKQKGYQVGEIITFRRGSKVVTHRIYQINDQSYVTKGDANQKPDIDQVLPEDIIGQVRLSIPRLGRLLFILKNPLTGLIFIIIPGTVLIWEELKKIIRLLKQPRD